MRKARGQRDDARQTVRYGEDIRLRPQGYA